MGVTLELSKLSSKELLEIYIDMKDVLQHNVDLITNFDVKSELHDRIFND
jgi:predicted nucleotidyltransferase